MLSSLLGVALTKGRTFPVGKIDFLDAYSLDFLKHIDKSDILKVGYVWKSIPSQLSRENKKFLYQTVKEGARAREYENAIEWLDRAGLVQKIYKISVPKLPLTAYKDLTSFKLYLSDIGLLRRLALLSPVAITEGNRLFTEFKGALSENYILQSLITQFESKPFYWTSDNTAEVDFVIQHQNELIPIEVKSGVSVRSRSLSVYSGKYSPKTKIRYSLKNLSFNNGLLNIPLFLADDTLKIINSIN